ncbi:hypothetical protein ABLN79_20685 [Mycobacterium tuberculosis]
MSGLASFRLEKFGVFNLGEVYFDPVFAFIVKRFRVFCAASAATASHEIDDDTAELALLSMHLDDEQRRLEAGMMLGWHPYQFPDEPDSKQ